MFAQPYDYAANSLTVDEARDFCSGSKCKVQISDGKLTTNMELLLIVIPMRLCTL